MARSPVDVRGGLTDSTRSVNRQRVTDGSPAKLKGSGEEGLTMDRRDIILDGLDLISLRGLEIGTLSKPLVRPAEGQIA
jgi:hypothetical protein